jgi:hypothetical protein
VENIMHRRFRLSVATLIASVTLSVAGAAAEPITL